MTLKDEFISLLRDNVKRDGVENLINYLTEQVDFFNCPASTKYHGSYPGGLVEHSINVYYCLIDELQFIYGADWQKMYSMETVAIVSLLHDLCKIGRYRTELRNVKDKETGVWETKEVYVYNQDCFHMGHAALSLHIINKFMILSDEEAQAIYWHMGGFDISPYSTTADMGDAFRENTLAFALHRADMMATYVPENDKFKPLPVE